MASWGSVVDGDVQLTTATCVHCRGPVVANHANGSNAVCASIQCRSLNNNHKNSANAMLPLTDATVANDDSSSDESPLLSTDPTPSTSREDLETNGSTSSHCHGSDAAARQAVHFRTQETAKKRLGGAVLLCALFASGEMAAGLYIGSSAIVTDALHMLTDATGLIVSFVSVVIASRPASKKDNFGRARAEAVGALITVGVVYVLAGVVIVTAARSLWAGDFEIKSAGMIVAGTCAIIFNVILFFFLKGLGLGHSHGGGLGGGGHSHFENEVEGERKLV